MTLKEAISILASHQKWRLGDENTPMTVPSELTDAISVILDHIVDTNEMVEISDEQIMHAAEYEYEHLSLATIKNAFVHDATWYREQLKKKQ